MKNNHLKQWKQSIDNKIKETETKVTFTFLRKTVTFRSWLNEKLRVPQRVKEQRLITGLVVRTESYKNTKIIKVY